MPLLLRVSATDYIKEGINCNDMVEIIDLVIDDIDLVALGRELLRNPYFVLNAGKDKYKDMLPRQYERGFM